MNDMFNGDARKKLELFANGNLYETKNKILPM